MNKILVSFGLVVLFLSAMLIAGCGIATKSGENSRQDDGNAGSSSERKAGKVSADFKTIPAEVLAGEPAELVFTVRNDKGEVIKDLPVVHESRFSVAQHNEKPARRQTRDGEVYAGEIGKHRFYLRNGKV